jgi:hypothetical protein
MENEKDLVRASSLSQSKKRAPSVTNLSQSRRTEQNESEASKTASSVLVSGLNLSREISRSIQRQKPLLELEYNVYA